MGARDYSDFPQCSYIKKSGQQCLVRAKLFTNEQSDIARCYEHNGLDQNRRCEKITNGVQCEKYHCSKKYDVCYKHVSPFVVTEQRRVKKENKKKLIKELQNMKAQQ